jgi:uncharacterized repeat protein (TIGR01451 family)
VVTPTVANNLAYVAAGGGCSATNMFTNMTTFSIQGQGLKPDYLAMKFQTPAALVVGSPVTYQVVVENTGVTTIDSLVVVDTISPVITASTGDQPAAFGAPLIVSVPTGTRYVWSGVGLGFMPGMVYTFTITGVIGPVDVPTVVSNTAYVIGINPVSHVGKFTNMVTGSADAVGSIVSGLGKPIPLNRVLAGPAIGTSVSLAIGQVGITLDLVARRSARGQVHINPKQGDRYKIIMRPSGPGAVYARIYEMSGVLVREIREESSGANVMTVWWNGTDNGGTVVPPGAYFLVIEGPDLKMKTWLAVVH